MSSTLLAQGLILTLDLTVTILLCLHYRNLKRSYLALGVVAGVLACARQLVDTLVIVAPDWVVLFHVSTSLQFLSSLVLVGALLRVHDDSRRITRVAAPLALLS